MSCPPEILAKLKTHREVLAHGTHHQEWLCQWWARHVVDDRRTLLALAGLDDDVAFARRPWLQLTTEQRDQIVVECKKIARLVGEVIWA